MSQFVAVVALHFGYIFLCTAFALVLICTLVDFGSISARPTLPCYLVLVFALKPIWFALPPWAIRAADLVASWRSASNST